MDNPSSEKEMGSPVPSGEGDFGNEFSDDISDGFSEDDMGGGFDDEMGSNEKPFNDEPFDAGVETSEEENPEKFIQQLSGKLGQSLRKYTEEMGSPDFELEKFAINSVLSATNSSKMDKSDQSDIIQKVKSSGNDAGDDAVNDAGDDAVNDTGDDFNIDDNDGDSMDFSDVDMKEAHNPNGNNNTVFKDSTLGVKDGGMEENKYLNLENLNKNSIIVKKLKKMLSETIAPEIKPEVSPKIAPNKTPRRRNPYRIIREGVPNPKPKASN